MLHRRWSPARTTRTEVGAREKALPLDAVALETSHQLYFSGESRVWGGSPAFIDTKPVDGVVGLARAYLIGWDQFEDVVAQENGRRTASIEIQDHDLVLGFSRQIGPGRYENFLCTQRLNDIPVATLTAPWSMRDVTPSAPSAGYLAMLIGGLREAHDLTNEEVMSYLGSAPGCSRNAVMEAFELVPRVGGKIEPPSFGLRDLTRTSTTYLECRPHGQDLRP